jgi:hypothetical protein
LIHILAEETEKEKVSEVAVPSNLKLDWHDLRIHTFAKNTLWLYLNDDVSLRFAKVEVQFDQGYQCLLDSDCGEDIGERRWDHGQRYPIQLFVWTLRKHVPLIKVTIRFLDS